MRLSIVIDRVAAGSCRPLLWLRHYGGLSVLVVMAVLFGGPNLVFAQYPGLSNANERASVSADAVDTLGGTSGNDVSSSSSAVAGADSAASSNLSGSGDGNSQAASNGFGVATNRAKARQSREDYFERKLHFEFAVMELVERRTGMVFSRHDVPRYLDELRAELAEMQRTASAPVQSLALDVQHIDTELNKHIDKMLTMIGTSTTVTKTSVAPSFANDFFESEP
ncbi:hypothetical protein OAQ37_07945, partial [Alphaproteobacteria bacterium]|nr:hypothetical protein [Alphaproteobacteria bacterium]